MIMLAFLISEATSFSQEAKENEKADSRLTWCSQDHNMVSPGSWAGLAPCLFERQRSSPSWIVVASHSWANERCSYSLMFGTILWFLILDGYKEGNTSQQSPVSQLFLKTKEWGRRRWIPWDSSIPSIYGQCVECLYSPLLKLHRQ